MKNQSKNNRSKSRSNKYQNRDNRTSSDKRQSGGRSGRQASARSDDRFAKDQARNVRADGNTDALTGVNDLSWYTRFPSLSETSAKFPYPYRPGMEINFGSGEFYSLDGFIGPIDVKAKIPGVMTIAWSPSLGYSDSPTDPASNVGKEIYARVRSMYSSSLEADSPDFVMYLMALDSVFSYIAWLKRVYRTLNAWSPDNFVTPDWLLKSYGFFDEQIEYLRANRAQLLNRINELILQTGKFKCPAIMDVFNRHYWMSDNVYLDTNSINGQMYCFNPTGFLILDANAKIPGDDQNTAAGLIFNTLNISSYAAATVVDKLYTYGKNLIRALDEWDEGYTISGYLRRAYDSVPNFSVSLLEETEIITPLYVEEVLAQIENARAWSAIGTGLVSGARNVYQDPTSNSVISQPTCSLPTSSGQADRYFLPPIISIRSDMPTVADNIIATRLQTVVTSEVVTHKISGKEGYRILCGTELVESMRLMTYYYPEANPSTGATTNCLQSTTLDQFLYLGELSEAAFVDQLKVRQALRILEVTQYDWHPLFFVVHKRYLPSSSSSKLNNFGAQLYIIGDIHNVTTVSPEQLELLHRVCLFSEFNAFNQQ